MIIKTDKDTIRSYLEDSSNLKGGYAEKVVIPENASEVSRILKEANSSGTPVTVSGGGTATTASRVPFGGIVLSMERFNKIHKISPDDMSVTLEAGVSVDALKEACAKKGLFYASHPTEKLAFVGGTIATNASGSRSFKYGSTRSCVKGLKMVLSNGEVFEVKRGDVILKAKDPKVQLPGFGRISLPLPTYKMPAVKNAAGYFMRDGMDLVDLFIGQEGTLSVILEADLGVVKAPRGVLSCFVFFEKEEYAWHFSKALSLQHGILDVLSIEYFDHNAVEFLRDRNSNVPISAQAAIFFEEEMGLAGGDASMDKRMELIADNGASLDNTWVAMSEKEAENFTKLRYAIPETVNEIFRRNGYPKLSTDIAVPESSFFDMMAFYKKAFDDSDLRYAIFGHIGENHVHVNILPSSDEELVRAKDLALSFIKKGVALGGTVSAEHGIGKIKHRYLEEMYGRKGVLEMARMKKALDPNWILGLDNIFPAETRSFL